ncbi:MAG TPA: FHA domain-containing protein [Vicinamibacterales bacterium]|nr:FHA domain-containing protein [Vicinamibacterales bacterium]
MKKLVLSDGTRERELHLVGRIVVGRDPACEISHDDSLLSRRHAEFVTAGNVVTVKDLGSRNGVFVNGARASEQTLEPGDIVQIGPLRARFVVDAGVRSISPEALDVDRTAVIRKAPAAPPPSAVATSLTAAVAPPLSSAVATPVTAPAPAPVHPAVALAFEEVDEDATRLVPARAGESASESSPFIRQPEPFAQEQAEHADDQEDEDLTRFTAPPTMPAPRPVLRKVELPPQIETVEPTPLRPRAEAPMPPANVLEGFVYGQLAALALVVLSTATIAMTMWTRSLGADGTGSSSSLAWFALPVAATVVGTVVIGAAVNRRISRALSQSGRARI